MYPSFNNADIGKMSKKCIYCGVEISEESVVDFCEACGVKAFGKKMFDTIVQNMQKKKKNGDLDLYKGDLEELKK